MADDRLQDRADAARTELVDQLEPSAPDLVDVCARKQSRRRRLAAAAAVVAIVAGGALVAARPDQQATLTTGPPLTTATTILPVDGMVYPPMVTIDPRLPVATDGTLAPGEVRRLPPSPLSGRSATASVWTGTEMLIWGGSGRPGGGDGHRRQYNDGAAYEPRRATWRLLPEGPLSARYAPAAVWTGKEMLLWGGGSGDVDHNDGAAFDPATGKWRKIADAPVRSANGPIGLWTGTEMLVMAGLNGTDALAYDPATDTWRRLPNLPGQMTGPEPAVLWTGTHVVALLTAGIGSDQIGTFQFDPVASTWTELPRLGGTSGIMAVYRLAWTGERLLAVTRRTASALDPGATSWTGVVQLPENLSVGSALSVWTGTQLLLAQHGGEGLLVIDPARRSWRTTPASGMADGSEAVWADGVLLAWGGFPDGADGLMLRPNDASGQESPVTAPPATPPPPPDRIRVSAGTGSGFMDQNGPLLVWNGRTIPVRRVEDEQGNLIGYFGCHFFERSEVERDDFDANAACPMAGSGTAGP